MFIDFIAIYTRYNSRDIIANIKKEEIQISYFPRSYNMKSTSVFCLIICKPLKQTLWISPYKKTRDIEDSRKTDCGYEILILMVSKIPNQLPALFFLYTLIE